MTKPRLSLFNHEKRIRVLEGATEKSVELEPVHWLDAFVQTWGPVCGIWAFIIVLVMLIFPTLR